MNKFMLQDIKMIKRESDPTHEGVAEKILEDYKKNRGGNKGGSRAALWALAGISLVVLIFAISFLFSQAKVVVTPKSQTVTLDNNAYAAVKNGGDGVIGFQFVNFSGEESTTIPAANPQQVSTKATGTIVVYNEYGPQTQKLVAGTRFQTADGKVYKMDKAVTVPGMTTKNGAKVPGSIPVTVTASEAGDSYNIGLSDFTIPGFQSDAARYAKFYGRSQTPMAGGATGVLNSVALADYTQSVTSLDQVLKDKLVSQVKAQIPKGYVLFDGAVSYVPEDLGAPNLFSKTNILTITKRGTINAILFDEKTLTQQIAKDTVSQYNGEDITIENNNDLALSLKDTAFDQNTTQVNFTLSGSPELVWVLDEAKLKADLAGQSKSNFNSILKKYTGIESAEVVLKPFWRMSFPQKADAITIENTSAK